MNRQWYYFYAMHGPGHQSTTDGFFSTEKGTSDEDVREYIDYIMCDRNNVTAYWWKVKQPPKKWVDDRMRHFHACLADAAEELKVLSALKTADAPQEDGADDAIVAALIGDDTQGGVIHHSLLELMHQKGLYYKDEDISAWWHGRRKPAPSVRRRVLNAINKADRYPCYKKKPQKK